MFSGDIILPTRIRSGFHGLTPKQICQTRVLLLRYFPPEIVDCIFDLAAYFPSSMKVTYEMPHECIPIPRFTSKNLSFPKFDIWLESPPLPTAPASLRLVLLKRTVGESMNHQVARLSIVVKGASGAPVILQANLRVPFQTFVKSWTATLFRRDIGGLVGRGDRIIVLATFSQTGWQRDVDRLVCIIRNRFPFGPELV